MQRSRRSGGARLLWETVQTVVIALVLAVLIRHFIVQTYRVQGPSMQPTLHTGERLLVNSVGYRLHPPQRGDIVIIRPPSRSAGRCPNLWFWWRARPDIGCHYVKRVVALGGDTVQMKNGWLYVDGQRVDEPYIVHRSSETTTPHTIPRQDVWVLGDNRPVSEDSRAFGPVPLANVEGKAMVVWWPFSQMHWIH